MLMGLNGGTSIWIGVVAGVLVLLALIAYGAASIRRNNALFDARFPTPDDASAGPTD
jgi:hypothetical protein